MDAESIRNIRDLGTIDDDTLSSQIRTRNRHNIIYKRDKNQQPEDVYYYNITYKYSNALTLWSNANIRLGGVRGNIVHNNNNDNNILYK